jgi:hypothetical protein
MGFSSRRNKRGGDKIEDLQSQLDSIQSQVNELKNSSTGSEPVSESFSSMETISEPESSMVKTWVDDKNLKFKDGDNGRVSLSFNRIMTLLDNLIKKGDAGKDWVTIKSKLNDATSVDGVQDVIKQYQLSFASNYIAGTRRKRRNNKKRTSRKR